ncbi:hypothetical protein [Microbacterium sp.]|uniref:hypothetical protein n=1 Tax=Microbacterium sp. TaxID=51671 RepID=UPI0039E6C2E0
MKTPAIPDRILSRNDVVALWFFLVVGAALVVMTAVFAGARIVDAVSATTIQVPGEFSGTTAEAAIGPDGAPRTVELDSAFLITDGMSVAGRAAIVVEQVLAVASTATVVGCLIALSVSVLRGRVFSRRNTVLVNIAGAAALCDIAVVPFFGNMAANDAFRAISDGTFNNVIMTGDLTTLFLAAFVVATASMVFTIGDRLQRDTEGLV